MESSLRPQTFNQKLLELANKSQNQHQSTGAAATELKSTFNRSRRHSNIRAMVKDKKWVLLNVGGTYFMTSRPTLTRSTPTNSPLHQLSVSSTNVQFDRDDKGAYLIDRDPAYFQVVLNFLRHGHILPTRDTTDEGILIEAEYFNLPELIEVMIRRLSRAASSCTASNRVFAPWELDKWIS